MNDKLRVSVGESRKLVLVQVHDEELVGGGEFHWLPRELLIEVGSIAFVFLLGRKHRITKRGERNQKGRGGDKSRGSLGAAGITQEFEMTQGHCTWGPQYQQPAG